MKEQEEFIFLLSGLKEQLALINNRMIKKEDSINYTDETLGDCALLLTHIIAVKGINSNVIDASCVENILFDIKSLCEKYLNKNFLVEFPLN